MGLLRFWFVLHLLFSALLADPIRPQNRVVLERNGYESIVVAISPDVPDYRANTIIQNIQSMIQRASAILFEATKKRAYFRKVHILIPDTWKNVQANVSTWETYSTSDIRVNMGNWLYGDMPFTVQSGGCGQSGEYIHLSPAYLLSLNDAYNVATYGPSEKVFVHHWARYRYGVFEENGAKGNAQYPLFLKYSGSNRIEPNLCSNIPPDFQTRDLVTQGPCRIDPATGIYDDNCVYELLPGFTPASSLMSLVPQALNSMSYFCEDSQDRRHVYEAPTKHNAMCGSKSVWSVISQHHDFTDNANSPLESIPTDTKFEIVRSGGSRFVLLMDTSGSMKEYNRIQKLYESARRWIKFDISDGSQLGMVQFSTQAVVLSPLIKLDGEDSRERLIAKLPRKADGWTCIGCGLLKSLEILALGGDGGVILLITDGEETNAPFIKDVLPRVMQAGVRVVSIAFGKEAADKIEELAEKTSGKSYFISDNDNGQGLNDAFIGSLTYQPEVPSDQIHVLLFQEEYRAIPEVTKYFSVDFTVGRNLVFRIDYSSKAHIRSFLLVSPTGTSYTQLQFDDATKVAFFKLDEATIGLWTFTLKFSSSASDSTNVHVTAQTRIGVSAPITSDCYVPDGLNVVNAAATPVRILAKVMQGSNPVVRAKVKAYVGLPNGAMEILDLYDDGSGADTTRDDGIYSRYLVTVNYAGRYTVQCQVWDDGSAYINDGFIVNRAINTRFRRNVSISNATKTGFLSRQADGGSFKITQALSSGDKYPPSQIRDLTVRVDDASNFTFTMQFTAPGDELDLGTVAHYEVRYSLMLESLFDEHFGVSNADKSHNSTLITRSHVLNGTLTPLVSGSKQIVKLALRKNETSPKSYFMAVRGVDRAGRNGTVSNIVTIDFTATPTEARGLSTRAIIGIAVGVLLTILLIMAIAFLLVRRRHLNYQKTNIREVES